MKYVSLQVPQALYLRTLQFIGAESASLDTSGLQGQLVAQSETNRMLSELVASLRQQLEETDRELWALKEMRQLDRERAALLRDDDYTPEALDRTLTEDRHESTETAAEDAEPPRHEAPAEPEPAPAEEPQPQPQAEAPAPPAPRPQPAPAQQPPTEHAKAWLDQALTKGAAHDFLCLDDIVARAPEGTKPITVSKLLRARKFATFRPIRQSGPKKGTQAVAFKGIVWAQPAEKPQEPAAEPPKPLTPAEHRKAESAELNRLAAAARAARGEIEVNRDPEPEPKPGITPKVIDRPQRAPILHVPKPKPGAGIAIVKADGTVTTVQRFAEDLEGAPEPIKPEDADGLTFDIYSDCKNGTSLPYSVADDVLALYGLDRDMLDAAVRNPQSVEIRPESKDKGYPVLMFRRGDLDVVMGFRTPNWPKVIAAYMKARPEHDTHRVNHIGGGGARKSTGLPSTVKASVRQLKDRGLEISDAWESAVQPVEVTYKGQALGKMKVHLADKKQIQGDYQRLLRQAHAIDRREEAKGG